MIIKINYSGQKSTYYNVEQYYITSEFLELQLQNGAIILCPSECLNEYTVEF